ncbi:MAG: hypothetical protein ACFE8M_11590, partial [Candidatus Hermodarchaeota archaeon]
MLENKKKDHIKLLHPESVNVSGEIDLVESAKGKVKSEINPFEMAKKQIDIVAEEMGLNNNIRKYLKRVERSLIVSIPIKKDN